MHKSPYVEVSGVKIPVEWGYLDIKITTWICYTDQPCSQALCQVVFL